MPETKEASRQFEQLIRSFADKSQPRESSAAEEPVSVQVLLDYVHDPVNISADTWNLIEQWTNNHTVQEWLKMQLKEGERREYGIVYDVVEVTSPIGTKRVEVKFVDTVGLGGFTYASSSGNPEVAHLQAQEPNGFQKGDIVETTSNGNKTIRRIKFRGSKEDELKIRLDILSSAEKVIRSLGL